MAAAGWLLVRGYADGSASTPAALLAKAGRLVAYTSFLLAVASLAVAAAAPVPGMALVLWNMGAGQAMSLAAERLDRKVRSELLSGAAVWAVAVAVCATAGAVGAVAAGSAF